MCYTTLLNVLNIISGISATTAIVLFIWELANRHVSKRPLKKFLTRQNCPIKEKDVLAYSENFVIKRLPGGGMQYSMYDLKSPKFVEKSVRMKEYALLIHSNAFSEYKAKRRKR